MDCLQSLSIDITIWNDRDWETKNTILEDCFFYILEQLKIIKANNIELKLNKKVPESARRVLERLDSHVRKFRRLDNEKVLRYAW